MKKLSRPNKGSKNGEHYPAPESVDPERVRHMSPALVGVALRALTSNVPKQKPFGEVDAASLRARLVSGSEKKQEGLSENE